MPAELMLVDETRAQVGTATNPLVVTAGEAQATAAALSSVNSTVTSTALLAANAAREGVIVENTDANILYIKYGTTASATDYTLSLLSGDVWIMDPPIYKGIIHGIWSADGSGAAKITELT